MESKQGKLEIMEDYTEGHDAVLWLRSADLIRQAKVSFRFYVTAQWNALSDILSLNLRMLLFSVL